MNGLDITPLFDTIIKHAKPYPDLNEEPLQLQISALAYDDYIGRLGIGRITKGIMKAGSTVAVAKGDGQIEQKKINQVFVYRGLKRMAVDQAESGDIVVISGISDISIGETICDPADPDAAGDDPDRRADAVHVFHGQQVAVCGQSRQVRDVPTHQGTAQQGAGSQRGTESRRDRLHRQLQSVGKRRAAPFHTHRKYAPRRLRAGRFQAGGHHAPGRDNGRCWSRSKKWSCLCRTNTPGSVISKLNLRKGMMQEMKSENGFTRPGISGADKRSARIQE